MSLSEGRWGFLFSRGITILTHTFALPFDKKPDRDEAFYFIAISLLFVFYSMGKITEIKFIELYFSGYGFFSERNCSFS